MARLQAFALGFVVANGLSNLGSLQAPPGRGTGKATSTSDKTLPDVNELFPSRSFSSMKTTVAELEKRLVEEQQQSVMALQSMKSGYERTLLKQRKNNSLLERTNLLISSRVRTKQKSNDVLRQRASDLVKANNFLKIELEALNSNLSLARDFVQDGLVASSMNESEIHVLAELAELDEKASSISRKQALLGSARKLSLMESVGDVHERSSDDILDTLTSSLARLASDANTSQSVLKEAFEKKLSEVVEKHDGLMRDQAFLNKTADEAENLHERLSAAVVHLSKVHQNLLARIKAIRAFAFRLGSPVSGDAGHEDQESSVVIHERTKPRRSRRHVEAAAGSARSSNQTLADVKRVS
eukprot:TRINITY_DN144_c1_g1_i12.p1 TRINITY_DN144_c1_g1~~TRINITY_DN144_c1_g1_i12.p1  ORF type:complete len:356 (-),score=79.41 TRINITY_DN144_c1_g1_i12:112-1179(-)